MIWAFSEVQSRPWPDERAATSLVKAGAGFMVDRWSDESLAAQDFQVREALARQILGERERAIWLGMKGVQTWRNQWLRGRLAAKVAVGDAVLNRINLDISPGRIEILSDESGRPLVHGDWIKSVQVQPIASIAHTGQVAVAVAEASKIGKALGIDIERADRVLSANLIRWVFSSEEQELISDRPPGERGRRRLRFWCAKEAVGKAMGTGLIGELDHLRVGNFEMASGLVEIKVSRDLAERLQVNPDRIYRVGTFESDGLITALTLDA